MKGHPEVPCSRDYNEPLRRQLLQERLRFLQIARVEALREPAVNRREQFHELAGCRPIPIAIGPLPSGVKKPPKALSTVIPAGCARRA